VLPAVAGCTRDAPPPPTRLSDGSSARPSRVALAGVDGPRIATRVRLVSLGEIGPSTATAACIGSAARNHGGAAIERVDVHGTTVSYLGPEGRSLHGCDSGTTSTGSRHAERWCGRAFGLFTNGRLRDPRLSLGCRNAAGEPIGFAWIEPAAAAAYVVVSNAGYSAVYPVTGRLPVRVGSNDVDLESSHATFDVSEHARDGRRLRGYVLEAAVSG
jgi:hypothetical protein